MKHDYVEMGFAKIDTDRKRRTGFPEVVFCEGKTDEFLVSIYKKMVEDEGSAFGTRATEHQYEIVKNALPAAEYDKVGRILMVPPKEPVEQEGLIAVCTAGTADVPVAEEAAQTAEYFGGKVETEAIQKAYCVICVAGMEGALASVMGGLVSNPIIAVPTSVGYGASFHGLSALLTMINSCANGISVVNIDNGYGAGYIATQINRLAVRGNKSYDS